MTAQGSIACSLAETVALIDGPVILPIARFKLDNIRC